MASLFRSVHGDGEHRRHLRYIFGAFAPAAEEQSARRLFPVREQHRLELGWNGFNDSTLLPLILSILGFDCTVHMGMSKLHDKTTTTR
jgi:hypothetical protein